LLSPGRLQTANGHARMTPSLNHPVVSQRVNSTWEYIEHLEQK
jgi:hypothetical protein